MKLNNTDLVLEKLQHASPVKAGKRFAAFLIDFIIVTILSYFIFLIASPIAMSTESYRESNQIVLNEVDYYNEFVSESRAIEFVEINGEMVRKDLVTIENPVSKKNTGINQIIFENVNRAIYRSVLKFGTAQVPEFVIGDNIEYVSYYGEASVLTDNIFYFYSQYIPLNNEGNMFINFEGINPVVFANNVYANAFGDEYSSFFVSEILKDDIPTLTTAAAYYLYYYIYGDPNNSAIYDIAQEYMISFNAAYSVMLEAAELVMLMSEPYYSTHYMVYFDNNAVMARIVNFALILSIVISYIIGVILPKILLKHGRTLGRLVFMIGEIGYENEAISWKQVLIKSLLGVWGFIVASWILYLFKPFGASYAAMKYPFIEFGEVGIPLIVILLIISLIGIINGCVSLFTSNKTTLIDLIAKTEVVDIKHNDDLINEG